MITNCTQCKEEFYRRPSDMRTLNFCSHKCRGKYYKGKFRGGDNPLWKGGRRASKKRELIKQKETRRKIKQLGVEFLGGKCSACGYNKCIASLDFHHPDPTAKDEDFEKKCETNWEIMKEKITGCILLCSNCHREHHYLYGK